MSNLTPVIFDAYTHTPRWYASYTRSRYEKLVARELSERGIEHFLPLYEKVHAWAHDRRKVQLPLFPGYVFVHVPLSSRLQVLETPGVVRLVCVKGAPAAIDADEIEALRRALSNGSHSEPCPYIKLGQNVRIESGPLQGLCGKVLRKNHHWRVVISIDLLMRSILVDVDADQLAA